MKIKKVDREWEKAVFELDMADEGDACLIKPMPVEKIGVVIPPEGLLPGGFAWHALNPPWARWRAPERKGEAPERLRWVIHRGSLFYVARLEGDDILWEGSWVALTRKGLERRLRRYERREGIEAEKVWRKRCA